MSSAWAAVDHKLRGRLSGTKGGITWGDLLRCSWKFKKPIDVFTVFMIANLICGSTYTQPFCWQSTWNWRHWLIVHSLAPSVWGWCTVDIFNLTPHKVFNAFQIWDMNNLSLSETIFSGKLFPHYQLSKNKTAKSSAVMSTHVGRMWMSAPKQSVMDRIQLYPESSFNGPMKSTAIDWPWSLGTGNGCKGPGNLVVLTL